MCKHGDMFSLRVLIGRGLDLLLSLSSLFFLRLLQFSGFYPKVGVDYDEDPPVPIPNTEVKLISVENTWRVTAWKDRAVPTQSVIHFESRFFCVFKKVQPGNRAK